MAVWIIEPRDALIVRDGRPFGPDPGARARSLPFPFPSTIAGTLRALWWTHSGRHFNGTLTESDKVTLLHVSLKGPLLLAYDKQGQPGEWLLPAPADALLLRTETGGVQLHQLTPLQIADGAMTDLDTRYLPVGLAQPNPSKPESDVPLYWRWRYLQSWLTAPAQMRSNHPELFAAQQIQHHLLGSKGPTSESRTHVRIQPNQLTAQEGFLFQTSGLEFRRKLAASGSNSTLTDVEELALAVATDADLPEGPAFLGGERRVVSWRKSDLQLPACPPAIRNAIIAQKHCRLVLATPAYFTQGDCPTACLTWQPGVTATVAALTVQRPQVVSGWDYATRRPKATHRLAPAGSVYFLKVESNDDAAIGQWVDQLWMRCVSDEDQACRDGFGLALLGTWDGRALPLQKEMES